MQVRVLDAQCVRELLPMSECIEVIDGALRTLAEGAAVQPLRAATWIPDRQGLIGMMQGFLGQAEGRPDLLGAKVISVFPGNHGSELDSHQGVVLLFDASDGHLRAIVDATAVTAIRTAAASAVATRALARDAAGDLAIIGTGTQASTHAEAMALVRPLRRVRVFGRDAERTRRFAEAASGRIGVPVEPVSSARDAVEGADLVCTVTSSVEPVVEGAWLRPGAHVNAVGACTPNARELDTAAIAAARLFVDRRESAQRESGDYLIPLREGAIGEQAILAEVGEVLVGSHPGRGNDDEITVFDSLGIAIEDLAAAQWVLEKAGEAGAGTSVELGGERF